MASTSETGHHKNVSSFEQLISFAQGFGTNYNPSKSSLKLPALQTQLASVKANITSVTGVFNKLCQFINLYICVVE